MEFLPQLVLERLFHYTAWDGLAWRTTCRRLRACCSDAVRRRLCEVLANIAHFAREHTSRSSPCDVLFRFDRIKATCTRTVMVWNPDRELHCWTVCVPSFPIEYFIERLDTANALRQLEYTLKSLCDYMRIVNSGFYFASGVVDMQLRELRSLFRVQDPTNYQAANPEEMQTCFRIACETVARGVPVRCTVRFRGVASLCSTDALLSHFVRRCPELKPQLEDYTRRRPRLRRALPRCHAALAGRTYVYSKNILCSNCREGGHSCPK